MKRGLKVFIGLVCSFVIGLPVFAQPSSKSIETFVMESFDQVGNQNYLFKGENLSWEWEVSSSRFMAEGFPKTITTVGIPNSLKNLRANTADDPLVFGVQVAFNRKGDNWFEVYPVKDGVPYEIPFIGNVNQMDFWVWGANYKYYLEVLLRDANGSVHVLPAGDLLFSGWKNKIVNIPGWVQQSSHLRSGPENMTFVGFRIRTDASEYVDNFIIFFDQMKYTTNSLSFIYDGYELKDVDFGSSDSGDEVGDAK
ncbi:MAG: flagellar filament outer layer protein FlaA [Treponema sp.]|nr:flagellar filament outer layer protein FlaA [Treponema sp.]